MSQIQFWLFSNETLGCKSSQQCWKSTCSVLCFSKAEDNRNLLPAPFHCASPMDSQISITDSSIKRVESKEWRAFGIKSLITVPLALLLVVTAAYPLRALIPLPQWWWVTPLALCCLNKMLPRGSPPRFPHWAHKSCFPHCSCTLGLLLLPEQEGQDLYVQSREL